MLPLCGFPSLIAVVYAEKRQGLEKHIPMYVFGGAKIEDSRNIKRVITVLCSVIREAVHKGMSTSSADTEKKKGFAALNSARLHIPVCFAGNFLGAVLVFLML